MPEGPELHLASRFINQVCNGRVFGKIRKSEISKNPEVIAPSQKFSITASSRGKEIKLSLYEYKTHTDKSKSSEISTGKRLEILVTFGLAGKFEFVKPEDLAKHAHLNFYTEDCEQPMVLSFVDYMRFGRWTPGSDFSFKERGPCVLTDYSAFRENVLKNLNSSAFNRPICELLLNQKFFNGIGNYLRAEILYRAGIPPFVCGRNVIEQLVNEPEVKSEKPDVLQLCNILPQEVVALEGSWYDSKDRETLSNAFNRWLQCYYQDNMKNMADHNKRTIWYSGPPGPMTPKDQVTRGKKMKKPRERKTKKEETQDDDEIEVKPKKRVKKSKSESQEKVKTKKVKLEKDLNAIEDNHASNDQVNGKEDFSVIQEVTMNMHGTRLTRRKLKSLLEQKDKLIDKGKKTEMDQITKGSSRTNRTKVKSARTVLNNDAPYLNSAKQNGHKGRK